MKKLKFCLLMLLACESLFAEPFDIFLPHNTQYLPEVLLEDRFSFTMGFVNEGKNFKTQVLNKTDDVGFIDSKDDYDLSLGLAYGLGGDREVEINAYAEGSIISVKQGFESASSNIKSSLVVGYLKAASFGHGGNIIPEEEEDCSFLDLFCYLDFEELFCLGLCSPDVTYEFNYEAEIQALTIAYLQGYRYSASTAFFLGIHYAEYDIEINVIDNVGGADSSDSLSTNLAAITIGMQWKQRKTASSKKLNNIVLSYIPFKYSRSHDGEYNSEFRLTYVLEF